MNFKIIPTSRNANILAQNPNHDYICPNADVLWITNIQVQMFSFIQSVTEMYIQSDHAMGFFIENIGKETKFK